MIWRLLDLIGSGINWVSRLFRHEFVDGGRLDCKKCGIDYIDHWKPWND